MSLREGCALPFLRFKQSLSESTHAAHYSNGQVLPVWIRERDSALFVETPDFRWVDPKDAPGGFVGLEMIPEEKERLEQEKRAAEAAEAARVQKIPGSSWEEQRLNAERMARRNLGNQYADRKEQNSMPAGNPALTKASHDFAQVVAASKGQRK